MTLYYLNCPQDNCTEDCTDRDQKAGGISSTLAKGVKGDARLRAAHVTAVTRPLDVSVHFFFHLRGEKYSRKHLPFVQLYTIILLLTPLLTEVKYFKNKYHPHTPKIWFLHSRTFSIVCVLSFFLRDSGRSRPLKPHTGSTAHWPRGQCFCGFYGFSHNILNIIYRRSILRSVPSTRAHLRSRFGPRASHSGFTLLLKDSSNENDLM